METARAISPNLTLEKINKEDLRKSIIKENTQDHTANKYNTAELIGKIDVKERESRRVFPSEKFRKNLQINLAKDTGKVKNLVNLTEQSAVVSHLV